MRGSILAGLVPYVTSDFQSHSLLTVIGVVSDAMTAAVYIPMAKLLDVWGRAEGFMLVTISATLGVILMATSHNLAMFCAAQVWVVYLIYVLRILITTGFLFNRVLRHHLHSRCARSRCYLPAQSRYCLRVYIFAVHDHCLCRIQGC